MVSALLATLSLGAVAADGDGAKPNCAETASLTAEQVETCKAAS